jgi:endonuclease I
MKRILAMLLVACLILSLSISVSADGTQHNYSTTANSGIRHEVCTTLLGTSSDEYYIGAYTYDTLSTQSGTTLLASLRTLMTSTHTRKSSYNDCRDMAVKTDCENADGKSISLIYTSYSSNWSQWCNNLNGGWNREHVWPKSNGGFEQSQTPGCDLHHVRPSDQGINGNARGNKKYGNVDGGSTAKGANYTGNAVGGTYNSTYFEPLDNVKGDVARICLYVYVRYGSEYTKCNSITNVFQSVDVLLEWCALDPVDTWEMGRNEVVGAYQGNRNVFIDYPELAWLLFDKEIPADMTTPSNGSGASGGSCTHENTTIRDAKDATCTASGYTGDTYCTDCGHKVSSGSTIKATGHTNANGDNLCDTCGGSVSCGHGKTELRNKVDPTCGKSGYSGDLCCVYCSAVTKSGDVIPSTGEHTLTSDGMCSVCGYSASLDTPTEPTDPSEPTTDPSEPTTDPSEPATDPSEPITDPSEPATDPSESTQPAEPTTPAPQPTDPNGDPAQKPDYLWLVYVVIGVGAVVCIAVILIQNKKHHE